jgi:hypothetical protein
MVVALLITTATVLSLFVYETEERHIAGQTTAVAAAAEEAVGV